jgi:hypothetical protein
VTFRSIRDRNIWLVYVAILMLGLAYGISLALVGLYLDDKGYTKSDIGSLAVWFAGGIVILSQPTDRRRGPCRRCPAPASFPSRSAWRLR